MPNFRIKPNLGVKLNAVYDRVLGRFCPVEKLRSEGNLKPRDRPGTKGWLGRNPGAAALLPAWRTRENPEWTNAARIQSPTRDKPTSARLFTRILMRK
jgi:hypothetical protein